MWILVSALALMLCGPAALTGCSKDTPEQVESTSVAYTTRGQIVQVPDPDSPLSDLQIHHEEIPEFVSKSGEVVGMREMTMPFPPAEGVSLRGLNVGDKVEVVFEVDWDNKPYFQMTKITKLAPETELNLTK